MPERCCKFRSLVKKLPVTSVQFLKYDVLAGVAGDLYILETKSSSSPRRKNILGHFCIHGIVLSTTLSKMCVFGGPHITFVEIDYSASGCSLTVVRKWQENDWVLSCQWVADEGKLAVLSAHNVLSLWDSSAGLRLTTVSCVEKCILYSATVLVSASGWKDTIVIAGTVFQQIIIWAVADESSADRPVLHRLCGHKGVIFSVTYDERLRLICSTSDDRSVRVWSVTSPTCGALTADDWKYASIVLTVTIFGHTARVWQSSVLSDKRIISIGEDSMLCLWGSGGKSISQRETHQGGGAWCVDVNKDQSMLVTGGEDGGVTLWPLEPPSSTSHSLPPPPDTPRRVALLQGSRVITVTEDGSLMLCCDQTWTTVFNDSWFTSYCLLEVSPSREFVGLASIGGHIIILRSDNFEKVVDRQAVEGRIYSFHWLGDESLVTCHDQGNLIVWNVMESGLEEKGRCHLPASKERWTTSAVLCGSTLIYGDRAGNIHSSSVTPGGSSNLVEEVRTVRKAHSRLGVCSLTVARGHIWSSGRDGTVKQYTLSNHSLTLMTTSKLPLDWVATVIHTSLLGDCVLCFHESSIVLWSIKDRRKLISLHCGGGHRSWSYLIKDGEFYFTYLKDKTAHLLQCPVLPIPRPVLMEGFHTREILSMVLVGEGWVASGGEDGTIRLSHSTYSEWTTCAVERNHLSSVRVVAVGSTGRQTLLFSAGGRAQIKAWRICLNKPVCLTEVSSMMLRDERRGRHWLNTVPVPDPETRYMDLHILPYSSSSTSFCVLAACSDAYLRIFHFDVNSSEFCLHKSVMNGGHCMLRVTAFHCGNSNSRTVALTTATDGSVTFWDIETCRVLASEFPHQSGINGLSVRRLQEDQVLVVTGGDDNSIIFCLYKVSETPELTVQKVDLWTSSTLHTSVITGVEIVGERVICTGGDQRVTLLSWHVAEQKLSVRPLAQYCCSVSDIKGLVLLDACREKLCFCVYGVGMEKLEVEEENNLPD